MSLEKEKLRKGRRRKQRQHGAKRWADIFRERKTEVHQKRHGHKGKSERR